METDRYLYIKHMVCDRCIMAVTKVLERLGLTPVSVVLGRAELAETPTESQKEEIRKSLEALGFELIGDPRTRIDRMGTPLRSPPARQSLTIPGLRMPPRLQHTKQTVLRNARHHHRKILHRPKNRTGQGTARLRRTIPRRDCRPPRLLQHCPSQRAVQNLHRTHAPAVQTTEKHAAHPTGQGLKAGLQHPQTPNIIAGCMPKIRHNKRAIFNVGSDRPDT